MFRIIRTELRRGKGRALTDGAWKERRNSSFSGFSGYELSEFASLPSSGLPLFTVAFGARDAPSARDAKSLNGFRYRIFRATLRYMQIPAV